jgi:hypothetical protein
MMYGSGCCAHPVCNLRIVDDKVGGISARFAKAFSIWLASHASYVVSFLRHEAMRKRARPSIQKPERKRDLGANARNGTSRRPDSASSAARLSIRLLVRKPVPRNTRRNICVWCAEPLCDAINNPKRDNKHGCAMNNLRNAVKLDSTIINPNYIVKRSGGMSNLRGDRKHGAVGAKSRIGNQPTLDKTRSVMFGVLLCYSDLELFLASANGLRRGSWELT